MGIRRSSLYGVARLLKKPRAALTISRRLFAYYRDGESFAPPLSMVWELSNACDCFCTFCDTHALHKAHGSPTEEKSVAIARALGRAGVSMVGLSGGEPLLVPHLISVLRVLKESGIEVSVSTNGSQLERMAEVLIEEGVHAVTISLDSVDGEAHNRSRVHNTLYDRIEAGIRAFSDHPRGSRVSLRVRLVITPLNFNEVMEFADRWRDRVDEVAFQPVQDNGPGDTHHHEDERFAFRAGEKERFESVLVELASKYPEYRGDFYQRMPEFLFSPDSLRNSFHCFVPALVGKVTPHGDVVMCSDSKIVLGNLLEQELVEVWNHPAIKHLRTQSRHRCRECLCWINPVQVNDMLPSAVAGLIPAASQAPGVNSPEEQ